ncbi:hypothetical protein [Cryptosporidium hominis TU502]|uniref:hypothetical protein n=1 Tax=Cryptosporidium hominis (strain TU502) TaxID=353151 RepID=UPI0000452FE9|nr:hypothetical protein [Cryptosporidium hominis TU502]
MGNLDGWELCREKVEKRRRIDLGNKGCGGMSEGWSKMWTEGMKERRSISQNLTLHHIHKIFMKIQLYYIHLKFVILVFINVQI